MPSGIAPDVLVAVHEATRALLSATDPAEIVPLLVALVRELGGDVVPAGLDPPDAMRIDLGLGEVPPLLPVAPKLSIARLHLETLLPSIVEDARVTMLRLRNAGRLADEASVDFLTGVLTRRALFRQITLLATGDAVVLLDLDHFKRLNDSEGHEAGDAALAAFGGRLRRSVRAHDIVGRYGGEEFLIGLVHSTVAQAVSRMGGLRERWVATEPPVTFSAGVAAVLGGEVRAAVRAADKAMYRAKAGGRDYIEVARDDEY
jgi:diguanylate cyclase (GGDEF)-like protein